MNDPRLTHAETRSIQVAEKSNHRTPVTRQVRIAGQLVFATAEVALLLRLAPELIHISTVSINLLAPNRGHAILKPSVVNYRDRL